MDKIFGKRFFLIMLLTAGAYLKKGNIFAYNDSWRWRYWNAAN